MKKLVALILCMAMLCVSLAALADGPATIEFVGLKSEVQEVMKSIIADFEAENPDIHVEYAFIVAIVVNVIVSLITPAPSKKITDTFDRVTL